METRKLSLILLFLLVFSIFPLNVDTQEQPEPRIIGNPIVPQPRNWTRFWQLFNAYSDWDFEYNNGSGWISDRSQLQIIRNYTERVEGENGYYYIPSDSTYGDSVKITLNFTASYTADYRLTFAINLDVRNYTHREGSWNYTLSYNNYTVFFDWTDLRGLPFDNIAHGIMPVGDESYFWFRIRRNNIPEGFNVVIDPIFGNDNIEASAYNTFGNRVNVCNFTLTEDGTITQLMMYSANVEHGQGTCGVIYNQSGSSFEPTNLIVEGTNTSLTDAGWYVLDVPDTFLSAGNYFLGVSASSPTDVFLMRYGTGATNQTQRSGLDTQPSNDPWAGTSNFYSQVLTIFANYTVADGQDLTFNLFENFNIWSYFSRNVELSRLMFENMKLHSSSLIGREKGFSLSENQRIYSSSSRGIELGRILFSNVRLWSSITSSFEETAQDLSFILFDNVRLWSSVSTVFDFALDLSFILFGGTQLFSNNPFTTETSVAVEYATTGFVFGAMLLFFIVTAILVSIILMRRR